MPHFRTQLLREIGAWDPYNVTEDADLGMRLARAGYRTDVTSSTTQEEAPVRLGEQRTRWLKGWMQTWCVHMRQPWRLLRQLGVGGFAVFQLMIIGTVLAALLQPIAIALIVADFLFGGWLVMGSGWSALDGLHWGALIAGYLASVLLAVAGLARRR